MARVFRQQYTRPIPEGAERVSVKKKGVNVPAVRFKGNDGKWITAPIVAKGKGTGTHCRVPSPNWYGFLNGVAVPLCPNRSAAETMLQNMKDDDDQAGFGRIDFKRHRRRPIGEHLADFLTHLRSKDNVPRYVGMVGARLEALFTGCAFHCLADLDAGKAADWLAQQRQRPEGWPTDPGEPDVAPVEVQDERPALPAGYSLDRVAELLGIKPASIAPLVSRHALKADGNGKARRFPRETVEALLALRRAGASVATTNQYVMHLKVFGNWLVKPGKRIKTNPFDDLELLNEDADRRHLRRELTAGELHTLLTTARASGRSFRGLNGEARFVLYATACGTGFRAGGLASLTPECFDLDGRTPTVTLPVRSDKSRKGKVQPLPADVAELLRGHLDGKPVGVPIWPGKWATGRSAALMLRRDLNAAGIAYRVDGPDGPLYADFHALRHTYLTLGGRAGIDLRTLQELAGHSTAELTERYTHVRLDAQAAAVGKLPAILPAAEAEILKPTGTDGRAFASPAEGIPLQGAYKFLTSSTASERENPREGDRGDPKRPLLSTGRNPLTDKGVERSQEQAREGECRAGDGIRTHDVQLGKLAIPGSNDAPDNDLRPGTTPTYRNLTSAAELSQDLARIVEAWGSLPLHIRTSILALVDAAGHRTSDGT